MTDECSKTPPSREHPRAFAYSKYRTGHISLLSTEPKGDLGVRLCFRDIKIKELQFESVPVKAPKR